MIRPVRFQSNPQTANSNRFQGRNPDSATAQQAAAAERFDALAAGLRDAGINVIVIDDTAEPHTPDSVFPNNWISTHASGRVVLYPMEAGNRRLERRRDIVAALRDEHGFGVTEVVDLSRHEASGQFLEGTGSLVLDRAHRTAYACLSSRTHLEALGEFAQIMEYDPVAFDAVDRSGHPIYHTNVMMSIGEALAIVCADAIQREEQRTAVLERLQDAGHELLLLDFDQLEAFAGNMLELRNADGRRVLAMSKSAFDSLSPAQRERLDDNGSVVAVDISPIEASAGGSVRCMLAEIHLPASD